MGAAGILVHAIDDSAQVFYKKLGFKALAFDILGLRARNYDVETTLLINSGSWFAPILREHGPETKQVVFCCICLL